MENRGGALIAGLLLYGAYNTRTIYLFPSCIAILGYIITIFKDNDKSIKYKLSHTIIGLLSMVIGMMIVAYPQVKINEKYVGEKNPKVFTECRADYEYSLSEWQLLQGLCYERYETYAGYTMPEQEPGGVRFYDDTGIKIIELENLPSHISLQELLKLILKYPLDFIGIYIRATINYLTPIWSEVYIHDLYCNKSFNIIIGATLWIVAFIWCILRSKDEVLSFMKTDAFIPFISFITPCLMIIPGAPETRFFLPAYFVLYGFLCYKLDYGWLRELVKGNFFKIGIIYLAVLFAWITIISSTLSDNVSGTMLISKTYQKPLELEFESEDVEIKKGDGSVILKNNFSEENIEYAWHLFYEDFDEKIDSTPYSSDNSVAFAFDYGDGIYKVKAFVRDNENKEIKKSAMIAEFIVDGDKIVINRL